jgi:hypothetical protein|tara:strand:+ start:11015 stop:11386 length:372 start_codon:yes stop_codon:yes gene_type:complete
MAANDIYIGETVGSLQLMSALGRKLNINNIILSREDRTASGRLVQDIIATKKEINLRYNAIDGSDLTIYLDLFDLNDELIIRIYTSSSVYNDYTVLMSPLSYQRVLATGDGLWEGVTVTLREV